MAVTQNFSVKALNGKYLIDGVVAPNLELISGRTYEFDLSDPSLITHPLKFKEGGSLFEGSVRYDGTLGVDQVVTLTVPSMTDGVGLMSYYCTSHSGMGNDIELKFNTIIGSNTDDVLTGLSGSDWIEGINGDDTLKGGTGDDTLDGGAGDDTIDGGDGEDTLAGGLGNDTYYIDALDVIIERDNSGIDTVITPVSFLIADNLENASYVGDSAWVEDYLVGGSIVGNGAANIIIGNESVNLLSGKGGVDYLDGGENSDIYSYGSEDIDSRWTGEINDTGSFGVDEIRLNAGSGILRLFANDVGIERVVIGTSPGSGTAIEVVNTSTASLSIDASDVLNGLHIAGNFGKNELLGTAFDDKIHGYSGNDTIDAGAGNDMLDGGSGDDILTGGSGSDVFVFTGAFGHDRIIDYNETEDRLELYAATGSAIQISDLAESTNVDGERVLTTTDGQSITLINAEQSLSGIWPDETRIWTISGVPITIEDLGKTFSADQFDGSGFEQIVVGLDGSLTFEGVAESGVYLNGFNDYHFGGTSVFDGSKTLFEISPNALVYVTPAYGELFLFDPIFAENNWGLSDDNLWMENSTRPTVTSFTTTSDTGTYGVGAALVITATTDEAVAKGSTITMTFGSGGTVVLTAADAGTALTGTYTVPSGVTTTSLTVSSFTTTATDLYGNTLQTTVPTGSVFDGKTIAIDTSETITIDLNDNDGTITAAELETWVGLTGTAPAGSELTVISTWDVTGGSEEILVTTAADGTWEITPEDVEDTPYDGTYALSLTAKDASGAVLGTQTSEVTFASGNTFSNINNLPTGSVTISGTAVVGNTLSADTSTIYDEDGLGFLSYQWTVNGIDISSATSSTLTLGQSEVGKTITVGVSYTDDGGNAESVTSAATSAVTNVNAAPVVRYEIDAFSYDVIDDGIVKFDTSDVLSFFSAEDAAISYTYRHPADYPNDPNDTEILLDSSDEIKTLSYDGKTFAYDQILLAGAGSIIADNIAFNGMYFGIEEYYEGLPTALPERIAFSLDDQTIETQQDFDDWFAIVSETESQRLQTLQADTAYLFSDLPNFSVVKPVSISGEVQQGSKLTANVADWIDPDGTTNSVFEFQWLRDGKDISGATALTYTLVETDVGSTIAVRASYMDDGGTVETMTSSEIYAGTAVDGTPPFLLVGDGGDAGWPALVDPSGNFISEDDDIGLAELAAAFSSPEFLFFQGYVDDPSSSIKIELKGVGDNSAFTFTYELSPEQSVPVGSPKLTDGSPLYFYSLTVQDSGLTLSDIVAGTYQETITATDPSGNSSSSFSQITITDDGGDDNGESTSGGLDISIVSKDGDVLTFGIFADPITDPDEDGIGSFDFTLSHDASDMQIDGESIVFATGLSGVPNYDANSGSLTAGAFTLNNVEDLDAPLLTFEATMLDTKAPISIQITDIVVDGDDFASTTEVFDFSATAITTTITDRFGNAMTSAEAQAYEDSVNEITASSTTGNVTVFETASGTDLLIDAAMDIDTASDKAIGAFDALQALRLAVGLDKSDGTSEWHDYIAADINKDGRVGADDALNILKFAVGLTDGPSADWVFVDGNADYSEVNRKNTDYDEGILINDIMTDMSINMTGILVGDVDGSYIA